MKKNHCGGVVGALFIVLLSVSSVHAQPPHPCYPTPEDGVSDQSLFSTLTWWESESRERVEEIIRQSVYFSSDPALVEDESFSALVCDNLRVPYCDPNRGGGQLSPGTTYYWKVRVVDESSESTPVYSDIWSFTTTAAMPQIPCFTSLALPLTGAEMDTLRGARDEVLAATAGGRRLIDLYYSPHAVEALVIAFFNPQVRVAAYRLVQEVLPLIQSRFRGEPAVINRSSVAHAGELLALFAREASPEFKGVLEELREDIMQGLLIEELGFAWE